MDARTRAVIGAAIAAYLAADGGRHADTPSRWALAARPTDPGATAPWPVGTLRWAEAELPR